MKTGIFINEESKTREVFESLGAVVVDQYGKNYYRMDLILEQVGEDTFVVHFDNDTDLPEYMVAIRAEFIKAKNFGKSGLTDQELSNLINNPKP